MVSGMDAELHLSWATAPPPFSKYSMRIATGTPRATDPALLEDLAADIVGSALCDHERLATLPLTTGMRYFRSEVDAHILRGVCPAGVCRPVATPLAGVH